MTADIDPRLLATHPAPSAALADFGRSPARRLDDGSYVVGRPADVDAVLCDDAARSGLVAVGGADG